MFKLSTILSISAVFVIGCGVKVYEPRAVFDPNDARAITDTDILKAFEARPQLQTPARIAFYEMGRGDKGLLGALESLKQVSGVYEIPALLVEGRRHYQDSMGGRMGTARSIRISLKKLRLLAARARCDLLVLSSTVPVAEVSANWSVAFTPFLVTQFFVPMMRVKVTLKRELYVVDVRNGYLYRQVKASKQAKKGYVLLLDVGAQQKKLISRLNKDLRKTTLRQVRRFFLKQPQRAEG